MVYSFGLPTTVNNSRSAFVPQRVSILNITSCLLSFFNLRLAQFILVNNLPKTWEMERAMGQQDTNRNKRNKDIQIWVFQGNFAGADSAVDGFCCRVDDTIQVAMGQMDRGFRGMLSKCTAVIRLWVRPCFCTEHVERKGEGEGER